jgi:hypothetical protein
LCDIGLRQDARDGQRRVPTVLITRLDWPHGSAPHTATSTPAVVAAIGVAQGGNRARRLRVRSPSGRGGPCGQDLSVSRLRSRNTFRLSTFGGVAGRFDAWGRLRTSRGSAALAYPVLGQPRYPRSDPEVVLNTRFQAAGSTSSMRTPPASLGWMKLIREFAVPRRGAS